MRFRENEGLQSVLYEFETLYYGEFDADHEFVQGKSMK